MFKGRKYLLFLFSLSILFFLVLQLYMYKDKNSPKFDVENTKYPRGKHYVRIDKAVQNEIITLQPVSSIYHGFNSCLVPSKVDYTTLDFYETVSTNHRKNINNEYQTQDSSNLQFIEVNSNFNCLKI